MIELEKVHMVRVLQMPGGTSEILLRGERNGIVTSMHLDGELVKVAREFDGVSHRRLIPLSNIQSMEVYGRKPDKAGTAGGSKRSTLVEGAKAAGRGGRKKKAGKGSGQDKAP